MTSFSRIRHAGITLVFVAGLNGCSSKAPVIAPVAGSRPIVAQNPPVVELRTPTPWVTMTVPVAEAAVPTSPADAETPAPLTAERPPASPVRPIVLAVPLATINAKAKTAILSAGEQISRRSLSQEAQQSHQRPQASSSGQPVNDKVGEYARMADEMVNASKAEYRQERGLCACPEDAHFDGQLCGERSGYHGPKHAQPLCYTSDVTPEMVADYKRTKSLMYSVR